MTYKDEMQAEVNARIHEENHILIISAPKDGITLDTVNILDSTTSDVIASNVPEQSAHIYIDIWNGMLSRGEKISDIQRINIGYLTGVKTRKAYHA